MPDHSSSDLSFADPSIPDLDGLLREAAGDAAIRTRPADFEAVARGGRRRRTWSAAIGAGALAACMAVGTAVVVGRPDPGPPPAPPSAVVLAERDPVLAPLLVDIPVIAWTPDPGRSVTEVMGDHRSEFSAALGRGGFMTGNTPEQSVPSTLEPQLREAGVTGPWVIPTAIDNVTNTRAIATRLSGVAGVRDAELIMVRGMRFIVTVRARLGADEKEGGNVLIGQPGIEWGASNFKRLPGGDKDWTMNAYYLGGPLDRAGLDRIRTVAADAWHIEPGQVILTPQPLKK